MIVGIGLIIALTVIALAQAFGYRNSLRTHVLREGRIVLAPGQAIYRADDPRANGIAKHLVDGDTNQPALVDFPADHLEGTHFLIDTALTHWPSDGSPMARTPVRLVVYNGACHTCEFSEFQRYGRVRKATVEILHRRANNPDEEFIIPQAEPVFIVEVELADRPGPQTIPLSIEPLAPGDGWPNNMQYIVTKITVNSIYAGEEFADRVALAEMVYVDRPADTTGPEHEWQ